MAIHQFPDGSKVVTTNIFPPIPDRRFDWCAYFDGAEPNDNGSMMQGFGQTENEAIEDLLRLLEERDESRPCKSCCGSGFSGRGSGYDDVCCECGGLKYFR